MKQTFLPALAIPPVFPLFFDESCFVGSPVEGFADSPLESFWGPEGVRFGILPLSGSDGFSGPLLLGFEGVGFDGSSDGSSGLKGSDGSFEGSSGLIGFDGIEGSSGLKGFDGSSEGSSGLIGFDGKEGSSGLIGFDGIEGSSGLGLNGFEGSSGLGFVPGGPPFP